MRSQGVLLRLPRSLIIIRVWVTLLLFLCSSSPAIVPLVDSFSFIALSPASSLQQSKSASRLFSSSNTNNKNGGEEDAAASPSHPKLVNQKVAVAGATGRTGSLVVQELIDREVPVVAMVRSTEKANEVFGVAASRSPLLQVIPCDLTSASQVSNAIQGCDAAIWCATGFSDAPTTLLEKIKRLLGIALAPQQSVDCVGIPLLAKNMLNQVVGNTSPNNEQLLALPQVVMLSSAGVTRPSWDEAKKEKYRGCADIPIVRLNPFGILDVKAESEEALRQSGVNYCIVRPTGLNDQWPAGSRPLFSQGDVAVGRIHRQDVAKVLVDVLATPEATDKTMEVLALAGYPPARSIGPALERLVTDKQGVLTEAQLEINFALLQQLLPGEVQDAAKLAMGQTYEELDQGKMGRLGERGTENAEAVAPKPTSSSTTTTTTTTTS